MENKKLNVVLIKDERTDFLWKEEFDNLYTQLNNNQNIDKLSIVDLTTQNEQLSLNRGDTNIKIEDIKDSTVLFLTDGASNWRNFLVQDMITKLSNHNMVNILNVMPQINWRSLATGDTEVETVINVDSKNNKQLETNFQWYHEEDGVNTKDIYLTVPMMHANEENIDKLLNTMIEGGSVRGILIPTTEELINYVKNPVGLKVEYGGRKKPTTPEEIAAEKLGTFRFMTSPEAYDLATFLSVVDSFTIEDMKLVQNEFFPEGKNSHIAQVYLGGILKIEDKDSKKDNNTRFIFQEGVAKELFKGLRISEEAKMLKFLPKLSIMKNVQPSNEENKNSLKL